LKPANIRVEFSNISLVFGFGIVVFWFLTRKDLDEQQLHLTVTIFWLVDVHAASAIPAEFP